MVFARVVSRWNKDYYNNGTCYHTSPAAAVHPFVHCNTDHRPQNIRQGRLLVSTNGGTTDVYISFEKTIEIVFFYTATACTTGYYSDRSAAGQRREQIQAST